MKVTAQAQMTACQAIGTYVDDDETVANGVPVERTYVEPGNLVQLDLLDGRSFTMLPSAQATVTITISFDDEQVGEFDAKGVLVV